MYSANLQCGNFIYNSMLANALSQLLSANERKIIRNWINRLHDIDDNNQIPTRNDYMWFLLLTLQNKRITKPFNEMPYEGELIPLKDLLPKGLYNDIVNQGTGETNLAWVDQIMQRGASGVVGDQVHPKPGQRSGPPKDFLKDMPKPQRGVICYMGAFSDQQM